MTEVKEKIRINELKGLMVAFNRDVVGALNFIENQALGADKGKAMKFLNGLNNLIHEARVEISNVRAKM